MSDVKFVLFCILAVIAMCWVGYVEGVRQTTAIIKEVCGDKSNTN